MPPQRIDLHVHSTTSDGVYTPSEVVSIARQHKLDVIALTDHDNVDGLSEAQAAAAEAGLTVLPGIELATFFPQAAHPRGGITIDLLGYLFDPDHAAIHDQLRLLRDSRLTRAAGMVEKLVALGVPVALERVLEIAGSGTVGRPHIAQALLEAGHISTFQEAFDRFIDNGGPAYVDHYRLDAPDAITLLHDAGGVAALAHPYHVPDYPAVIASLAVDGLDAVEVYYPEHDADTMLRLRVLARQHGLVMTGGSDFHRRIDGEVTMGRPHVPPECVVQLQERAERYR